MHDIKFEYMTTLKQIISLIKGLKIYDSIFLLAGYV